MSSIAVDIYGADREGVVVSTQYLRALPVTNLPSLRPNKWRVIWPLLYAVNTQFDTKCQTNALNVGKDTGSSRTTGVIRDA